MVRQAHHGRMLAPDSPHFQDERKAEKLGAELNGWYVLDLARPLFLAALFEIRLQALLSQLLGFLDLSRRHA